MIEEYLNDVREALPRALESDSLLVNTAWEAISLYDKNSDKTQYFDSSLKYCADIGNAILKQGITSMIWHNFVSKKVAALANLIERVDLYFNALIKGLKKFNYTFKLEKVGKAPKDRLCRKDVGIPEEEMVKFLEMTLSLLDILMDANCNINEVSVFNYDSVRAFKYVFFK